MAEVKPRWLRQLLDFVGIAHSGIKAVVFNAATGKAEMRDKVPAAEQADAVPWEGTAEGRPTTFPPSTHSHSVLDIPDLHEELDGGEVDSIYTEADDIDGGDP